MEIEICSIKMLRYKYKNGELDLDNSYYIINTSYPASYDFLDELGNTGNMVVLIYDDIQTFNGNSFDEDLAQTIKIFVDKLPSNAKLYCCCDAGESRSAAVACAISRYVGQDEMQIWKNPHYHPNKFVYEVLCNVLGFSDTEDRINELEQISANSLSNAIQSSRN